MALYRPRQEERQGFVALLIRAGRAIGFAKARPGWDFSDEAATVRSLSGSRTFSTPGFVGLAEVEDWAMIGFEPLPPGLHSPRLRRADAAAIAAEIGERLVPGRVERPHDHWQPMHGDLGPWNLRWLRGTGPVVFDWEEATFGPPGADLVFHTAASLAMGIKHRGVDLGSYPEAVEYWRTAIPRRFGQTGADSVLARQMVAALSPS